MYNVLMLSQEQLKMNYKQEVFYNTSFKNNSRRLTSSQNTSCLWMLYKLVKKEL